MKHLPAVMCLAACGRVDPVPEDLSEPSAWLFGHFDEADAALSPHLTDLADYAATFEPTRAWQDRAFEPGSLTAAHLDDAGLALPAPAQARLAVLGLSSHSIDDHRRALEVQDRRCVEAPDAIQWQRRIEFGEDCFAAGACDELWSEDDVELTRLSGTLTQRHRTLLLADGREAIVGRAYHQPSEDSTDPALWGSLSVWIIDADDTRKTWRIETTWQVWAEPPVDWQDQQGERLDTILSRTDVFLDLADETACDAEAL